MHEVKYITHAVFPICRVRHLDHTQLLLFRFLFWRKEPVLEVGSGLVSANSNWLDYFAILYFQWLLIPEQYACKRRVVDGVNFEVCVELSAFYAYYLFFRFLGLAFLPLERWVGSGAFYAYYLSGIAIQRWRSVVGSPWGGSPWAADAAATAGVRSPSAGSP